jgi:hypothetical protein
MTAASRPTLGFSRTGAIGGAGAGGQEDVILLLGGVGWGANAR